MFKLADTNRAELLTRGLAVEQFAENVAIDLTRQPKLLGALTLHTDGDSPPSA